MHASADTAVPGPWVSGDLLCDGGKAAWRITAVLELDSSVYDGLWEVEPVDQPPLAAE
jgi:hypothetical protein